MSTKSRVVALFLAVVLLASTGAAYASAQTDGEYTVEASDTIDIPDRTVTVESVDYSVTTIGQVIAGETLEASTSGPDGAEYDVDLYTADQEYVGSDDGTDGSVSYSTENLKPGTYVLAVYTADGSIVSPQPVVVAGYETTLDMSGEITAGEPNDVSVQLNDVADMGSPENVEVVVVQDDEVVKTVKLSADSTYEYSGEIGSSLESGEYDVYAMVHTETTVSDGDNDIVGVSDAQTLVVNSGESQAQADDESDESDDSDDSDDSGGSGGSGDSSGSSGDADSDDEETATPTDTEVEMTTESTEMETSTEEASTEMATTTTESSMQEPDRVTTTEEGAGTESSMPNFAVYIVALALVAAALIARR